MKRSNKANRVAQRIAERDRAMNRLILPAALLAFAAQTTAAQAFEVGRRIKLPDWMIPYFVMLGITMAVFFIAAQLTKPRGVALGEVDHTRLPLLPRFYYSIVMLSGLGFVIMFMFGNFIERKDQFVADRAEEARQINAKAMGIIAASNRDKAPVLRLGKARDLVDLPPELAKMKHVTHISLNGTRVRDISVLAQMPQLKGVKLGNTKIVDLSPLAGLAQLEILEIQGTRVDDLTPLARLSMLKDLDASNTRVADVQPLAGLTRLERLDFGNNYVTSLAPLAGLTNLHSLSIQRTDVSDLSPLTGLPSLVLVEVQRSQVNDMRPALTWPAMQRFMDRNGPAKSGFRFAFTAGAEADPALEEISKGDPRKVLARLAAHYGEVWPPEPAVAN